MADKKVQYSRAERVERLTGTDIWELFELVREVCDENPGREMSCNYTGILAKEKFLAVKNSSYI